MPDDTPAAPALGFSITAAINQKRQIVVQSFVAVDTLPAEIAKLLDKVMDQVDRQENRYLVRDLNLVLENDERSLRQHAEQIAVLQNAYVEEHRASGRRGEFELKGQQKTNVENVRKTIESLKERVTHAKARVAELQSSIQVG